MKNKVMFALVAAAVLAAMGCWFCWHCPSRFYGGHGLFWRQLAWNGAGIAAFLAAWAFGWKRLLKSAPWLMAAWLFAFAAAHCCPPVNGANRWILLDGILPGPYAMIHINVITCFMPVFALFAAWLHDRKPVRRWLEWGFVAALAAVAVCHVVGSANRMLRIVAFFHPSAVDAGYSYMGCRLQAALSSANWFGAAAGESPMPPCPESDGMVAASAMLFGKWFPSAVAGLFVFLGAALTLIWKNASADIPVRRYVLLFGLWLVVPAAYCLLHSLALLPVAGMSPALAGYGGTATVMAWFGLGALAAKTRCG